MDFPSINLNLLQFKEGIFTYLYAKFQLFTCKDMLVTPLALEEYYIVGVGIQIFHLGTFDNTSRDFLQ